MRFFMLPLVLFALVLATMTVAGVAHATQPFAMPGTSGSPAATEAPPVDASNGSAFGFAKGPLAYAMAAQQSYYRGMARALRALNLEHSLTAAWTLVSLSFAYGIFHAVGPGHGKVVVTSYLLADEREIKRGVLLAFLSSFAQALTAIVAVAALAVVLGLAHRAVADAVPLIERVSFALLTGLGAWLLWRSVAPLRGHAHVHGHEHGHVHLPTPGEAKARPGWRGMAAMVAAVGLRPCTGAVLVLLFALTQGAFAIGALSAFAMSVGTAITVSTLAVLTLLSKNAALRFAGTTDGPWGARIERGFAFAGGLFILLMGIFLLAGSFVAPPQPLL